MCLYHPACHSVYPSHKCVYAIQLASVFIFLINVSMPSSLPQCLPFVYMCLCHPACPAVYLSYICVYAIQLTPLFAFRIYVSMPSGLLRCLPFEYMCLCHPTCPSALPSGSVFLESFSICLLVPEQTHPMLQSSAGLQVQ